MLGAEGGGIDLTSEYLVRKEMEHVFSALTPANRLVCEVCVSTGLRVGDVVSLKTAQLAPQFWIHEQKTTKKRRVNLNRDLLSRLMAQAGETWVFESRCNPERHRTRQAVWHDVKRAAKAFRLPQNVSVHSLRKMYAVETLERKKGDLKAVQKALNHSDQATTMVYVMALQLYESRYGRKKK